MKLGDDKVWFERPDLMSARNFCGSSPEVLKGLFPTYGAAVNAFEENVLTYGLVNSYSVFNGHIENEEDFKFYLATRALIGEHMPYTYVHRMNGDMLRAWAYEIVRNHDMDFAMNFREEYESMKDEINDLKQEINQLRPDPIINDIGAGPGDGDGGGDGAKRKRLDQGDELARNAAVAMMRGRIPPGDENANDGDRPATAF